MLERPPPSDASQRERAVMHEGSVLVQAPAGSGKTTLLVQRYLRVLALVEAPEHVLALTFTRRAAEEMRERVGQALRAARAATAPVDVHPRTWELARAAVQHLDARGIDPGLHAARLRIETIDAFNAWLAGNLPVGSGLGAQPHVADDPKPMYLEAARRALGYQDDDAYGAAVERVLALGDQRFEHLSGLVAAMLASRERWLPLLAGGLLAGGEREPADLGAVRDRFDEDLALLVSRVLADALAAIGAERIEAAAPLLHAAAVRTAAGNPLLESWRADAAGLRADPADWERWRAFAAVALTKQGSVRARLTVGEGFPPGCADKGPMLDLLQEIGRDPGAVRALAEAQALPRPVYADEDWERVRAVAAVMLLAAAELDRGFRERGTTDFPAVSMAARRALGEPQAPSDLALGLDYRLRHVLIDEFQDTSGAQLDLLQILTAGWQDGDGRSVFCVGDPMQSIYGFRQAEVRAFLELADEGLGGLRFEVLRLTDNFRAAEPLVEWTNAAFARILPRRDDRDRGAIAFRPSRAATAARAGVDPIVRLAAHGSRAAEAAAVADLIEARRAAHSSWRIAVLVRARSHARAIAALLRTRGIAFQAPDIEPLADKDVVRDLVMLARALLHLGDRTAWMSTLRAPWAGVELADLLVLARAAPTPWQALCDEAALARLSPEGRVRCLRLRETLGQALKVRSSTSFARWLERTWLALGGPCCLADASQIDAAAAVFERARELEARGLPDPADFTAGFADLAARAASRQTVEIMTIHKAKGLEFDLVVVPALERTISSRNEEFLLSREFARTGRDGMIMAARPAIGADADPLFAFLRRQARDAAALEAERLLYVACTRARSELMLTAVTDRDVEPRRSSLLAVLWPAVGGQFAAGADDPQAAAALPVAAAPPAATALLRVPADWEPPAIAATIATGIDAATPVARQSAPVFDWAGETARQVGILVHAQLQHLDPGAGDAEALRAREPHFRHWLGLHGVPRDRLDAAGARVVSALVAVQGDPRGHWILRSGRRCDSHEYALSGVCDGAVIHVVLDRSFIEDGVRWVIDYKTSEHQGGGGEEFLAREVERYRPQMQRYATLARRLGPEPVRVGLYFPLMRAWREWDPRDPDLST